MITDFAFGLLLASSLAMALSLLLVVSVGIAALGWLSKFAEVRLVKDSKGAVKVIADIRGRHTIRAVADSSR